MFNGIYENKKILITGHTGFKGGWLSLWLSMLGAKVVGYSLGPPSEPNLSEVIGLQRGLVEDIHGDVRELEKLYEVFSECRPDIVFHLAAQPLVRLSYEEPALTYETNVIGTVNVLEAARKTESVRAIVNVTSDKCYENQEWIWGYRENDPMGGHDPYSSSKGCAELVTSAYMNSFFSPEKYGKDHQVGLASVRAGNVIGGGDWGEDRLVPDCVRALSKGKEIVIRYPGAIRPWQHVLEPLSGYLLVGAKLWADGPNYAGGWNFGPSDEEVWNVEEVVQECIRLWGHGSYRPDPKKHVHEAYWLKLDCSKARIDLQWEPRYTIKQALEKTVEWYKIFYEGSKGTDMRKFAEGQIESYGKPEHGPDLVC